MDNPSFDLESKNIKIPSTEEINSKNETLSTRKNKDELLYSIADAPPWYICIFLGLQNYLEMISGSVACAFFLTPALCMADDDPNRANILNTLVFMSGIITFLQSTFGVCLPIVQGGSFSYLVPSLAVLSLPRWSCSNVVGLETFDAEARTEIWQERMREIQGAIICAALFEVIFALTGVTGFFLKYLSPLSICPALTLIGLALFKPAAEECAKNFPVSIGTLILLVIISQYLRDIKIPIICGKRDEFGKKPKFPIFQVFPILISLGIAWGICGILTITNVLPEGDLARTDAKIKLFSGSPWFRVPYPFQWGIPTVSLGAFLGLFFGVITSTVESLGDYYSCAEFSQAPVPPISAMNRGIFIEGLGCVIGGILGSGNGSTSYSNNIGTITVTKIASRRVIQTAGLITILLALVGKAGAIFIGIPDPIIGGLFCFVFPLVIAVGISQLGEICLKSSRNIFIVSFSIFMGLAVSQWMSEHPGTIKTGSAEFDSLLEILLSTGMFVGGLIGFILDNTIKGTLEERGLARRRKMQELGVESEDKTYDLPFIMNFLKKYKFFKYLPISPTYEKSFINLLPLPFFKKRRQN